MLTGLQGESEQLFSGPRHVFSGIGRNPSASLCDYGCLLYTWSRLVGPKTRYLIFVSSSVF